MNNNPYNWQPLLDELTRRQGVAEAMGGDEKIARQHERHKLTARERLTRLYDSGSFNEIGALAGSEPPDGSTALAGDGVVGGIGQVQGHSVVAIAEDFTVRGGSIGHVNMAKRSRLVRIAAEQGLPLVLILDGAGHRADGHAERYPNTPSDLQLLADLAGRVPIATLILGNSAGHGALTGMFADFIVIAEGAAAFTAGPPLVKAALGIDSSPNELGGAVMHSRDSGVAHNLARDEDNAFAQIKYFLSMLNTRQLNTQPDTRPSSTDPQKTLTSLIPSNNDTPYDIRAVINTIADTDSAFELQPAYGQEIVVCLARFAGQACMVIANQPAVNAGAITCNAAEKATHFITLADNHQLPLLFLVDNPGVMPGQESERNGILKASAKMYTAQRRFRGKKLVVTLRKAFGFGSSVMGMNPWDKQLINLALPNVALGGVPAIGGAAAAGANEAQQSSMQASQAGAWVPADAMAFDKIIEPDAMRDEVLRALLSTNHSN